MVLVVCTMWMLGKWEYPSTICTWMQQAICFRYNNCLFFGDRAFKPWSKCASVHFEFVHTCRLTELTGVIISYVWGWHSIIRTYNMLFFCCCCFSYVCRIHAVLLIFFRSSVSYNYFLSWFGIFVHSICFGDSSRVNYKLTIRNCPHMLNRNWI